MAGQRIAVGRLVSGIRNAETGGEQGQNTRYASTAVVVAAARDGGQIQAGAGPGADATYFPALYPAGGVRYGPNALWVSVLFDFGEGGLAVLALMMAVAAWRMRRSPRMAAILLPFLVASLVNSAIPDYSFTALAILLFAFVWARRKDADGGGTSERAERRTWTERPRPTVDRRAVHRRQRNGQLSAPAKRAAAVGMVQTLAGASAERRAMPYRAASACNWLLGQSAYHP